MRLGGDMEGDCDGSRLELRYTHFLTSQMHMDVVWAVCSVLQDCPGQGPHQALNIIEAEGFQES